MRQKAADSRLPGAVLRIEPPATGACRRHAGTRPEIVVWEPAIAVAARAWRVPATSSAGG